MRAHRNQGGFPDGRQVVVNPVEHIEEEAVVLFNNFTEIILTGILFLPGERKQLLQDILCHGGEGLDLVFLAHEQHRSQDRQSDHLKLR